MQVVRSLLTMSFQRFINQWKNNFPIGKETAGPARVFMEFGIIGGSARYLAYPLTFLLVSVSSFTIASRCLTRLAETVSLEGIPPNIQQQQFGNSVGILMAMITLASTMITLGLANKDLGKIEWTLEWLYSFPVSAKVLYLTRIIGDSLINQARWSLLLPLVLCIAIATPHPRANLLMAPIVTLYYSLLAATASVFVETAARKVLCFSNLKRLQALCTVGGTLLVLLYISCGVQQGIASFYVRGVRHLPRGGIVQWLLVPSGLPASTQISIWMGTEMASLFFLILGIASTVAICEWLTRDGLIGPNNSRRNTGEFPRYVGPETYSLTGMVSKEIKFITRDANTIIQVVVIPSLIIILYLTTRGDRHNLSSNYFRETSALVFCSVSFGIAGKTIRLLSYERNTFWQLMAFPKSVISIFLEKTSVWAAMAFAYASLALIPMAMFSYGDPVSTWADCFIALYGTVIATFIAAGLGILYADRVSASAGPKIRFKAIYFYRVVIMLYAVTIYSSSYGNECWQLILSTAFTIALWKKVVARAPYLWELQSVPESKLTLADGVVLAWLLFFIQRPAFAITHQLLNISLHVQLIISYGVACFSVMGGWYYWAVRK